MNRESDLLKYLAMVTMLIDHIGYMFFPGHMIWRVIGRISFPIFAWLIAAGWRRTRDWKRYAWRLFVFALLSQIPYMYFSPGKLNIFFTLSAGLVMIAVYESRYRPAALLMPLLAEFSKMSYGAYGIFLILIFHVWFESNRNMALAFIALNLLAAADYMIQVSSQLSPLIAEWGLADALLHILRSTAGWVQPLSVLAIPLLVFRDHMTVPISVPKWLAYGFYPGHIVILLFLKG